MSFVDLLKFFLIYSIVFFKIHVLYYLSFCLFNVDAACPKFLARNASFRCNIVVMGKINSIYTFSRHTLTDFVGTHPEH